MNRLIGGECIRIFVKRSGSREMGRKGKMYMSSLKKVKYDDRVL